MCPEKGTASRRESEMLSPSASEAFLVANWKDVECAQHDGGAHAEPRGATIRITANLNQ